MASTDSAGQNAQKKQAQRDSSDKQHAADILPSFGSNGAGRIGRYQIIKTLGEGSFGKVKCKFQFPLGRPYSNLFYSGISFGDTRARGAENYQQKDSCKV